MENIGVMLVDDEVLAIEYLRDMLSWEEYGFSVVAEATDGKKALERLEKYRPQIVFVDIRMPVMDGLEFCKRALALEIPLKIILITAYKDFDYARKAIELGVTNYILKHDINSATILNELKKAREELEKEKERKRIIRQKCFKDLLHGLKPDILSNGDIPADIKAENHIIILSQVDMPYPVIEEIEPHPGIFLAGIELVNQELPQFITNIENIDIDAKYFATMITIKRIYSQLETICRLNEISRSLQNSYRKKYNSTISVAVSSVVTDLDGLCAEYGRLQKILELRIFFGREKVFMFDSFPARKGTNDESLAEGLKTVERGLNVKSADEIASSLDRLFDTVYLWPGGLKKICRELRMLHDEFGKKYGLENLGDKPDDWMRDSSLLYDARGLKEWFMREFTAIIEKAEGFKNDLYSRKVQQAVSYIRKHYNEDISIEQVAKELDISSIYLMKLFQKEVRETFVEYLTSYRIETAKKLLSSGRYKVYEISEMVGYKSSQYFSQVFKKLAGKNPLDYKEGEDTGENRH